MPSPMLRRMLVGGFLVTATLGVAPVSSAGAQGAPPDPSPRLSVTASALGDIKRFSTSDTRTRPFDGNALAGTLGVATRLSDRWTLSLEMTVPRFTEYLERREVKVGTGKNVVTYELRTRTRNRPAAASVLAGVRGFSSRFLEVRYLAGLSFVQFDRRVDTLAAPGTPAGIIPRATHAVNNGTAATFGVDATVRLTRHLALVPMVRALAFDSAEVPNGFFFRAGGGVRWSF